MSEEDVGEETSGITDDGGDSTFNGEISKSGAA